MITYRKCRGSKLSLSVASLTVKLGLGDTGRRREGTETAVSAQQQAAHVAPDAAAKTTNEPSRREAMAIRGR
jgi:hypothetical protein